EDPETRAIPVIMVTGRVEEGDKMLDFELGADDYLTKPFSSRELSARIHAVARRRVGRGEHPKRSLVKAGELEIDRNRFEVRMKGRLRGLSWGNRPHFGAALRDDEPVGFDVAAHAASRRDLHIAGG